MISSKVTPSTGLRAPTPCAFVAIAGCLLLGCAGRSEFRKGSDLLARGDYRQAYYLLWEAYSQRPCPLHLTALREAGRRVAHLEQEKALQAEAAGDLGLAIEGFALAMEYDPSSLELVEGYARVWAMAQRPSTSVEGEIREALEGLVRAHLVPLRKTTCEGPLPEDPQSLFELGIQWLRLREDLETLIQRDEDSFFMLAQDPREQGDGGETRRSLLALRAEVDSALDLLERASEGTRKHAEGLAAEVRGDLSLAQACFLAASLAHASHEGAQSAHARVSRRLLEEAYQEAVYKARERDWRGALLAIERLLSVEPEHVQGLELRGSFRRELQRKHLLDARRFEDLGLAGCSLLQYSLAFEADKSSLEVKAALERMEASIERRLHPALKVDLPRLEAGALRARRDLWDVSGEAAAAFEDSVRQAAQDASGAICEGRSGSGPNPTTPEMVIEIEDLDFHLMKNESFHGTERSRYLKTFHRVPNSEAYVAARAVEAARISVARAVMLEAAVPPHKRLFAAGRVRLERAELAQAEVLLASIAAEGLQLEWDSLIYPTLEVVTRAEAAARYKLRLESRSVFKDRWVTVQVEVKDRVVVGDPARNVPPDPSEGLTREEALRRLGVRLGEKVAEDAMGRVEELEEQYYQEGVRQLEAHSFDVATENLVLFIFSRRGKDDVLARDAARRLRDLTGCDLQSYRENLNSARTVLK